MEQLFQAAGPVLLVWLVLVNVLNFALMGADKRRAKRDEWRVREGTFFVLALLGGTPGAIAGMYAFRHKTRHWYFRFGLPALLVLQVFLAGAVLWRFF